MAEDLARAAMMATATNLMCKGWLNLMTQRTLAFTCVNESQTNDEA